MVSPVPRPRLPVLPPGDPATALVGRRSIYFREVGSRVLCNIYERTRLGRDARFEGPAVVEEQTSTTLVPPGFEAMVDRHGNIHLVVLGS